MWTPDLHPKQTAPALAQAELDSDSMRKFLQCSGQQPLRGAWSEYTDWIKRTNDCAEFHLGVKP
jgi:hypothetical protein